MDRDLAWLVKEKYGGRAEDPGIEADTARLARGEPLAYVIGWVPFMRLRIYLDSHPLIPRPETEWWCEELAAVLPPGASVLDLCAGSGAVGCALLKIGHEKAKLSDRDTKTWPSGPERWPETAALPSYIRVTFGEIDPAHEATIWKNIRENHLDAPRARVRIGDLFAPFPGERFDAIAANPPYIPEARALDPSVAAHEPAIALRSGADGLDLIRRIAAEAPAHMNPGGELWMECDAEHAEAARALVAAGARRAELRTDPYGRPRLVVGYY